MKITSLQLDSTAQYHSIVSTDAATGTVLLRVLSISRSGDDDIGGQRISVILGVGCY